MRPKSFISILICFCLIAGGVNPLYAYTPLRSAVSISGEGEIPLTPGPLLDDFATGTGTNVWNDITGTFKSEGTPSDPTFPEGSCTVSYTNNPTEMYGSTGHSLKLNYDVSAYRGSGDEREGSYAGYFSKLGSGSLSAYTTLSFYVKGQVGGETFKIEFKNNSSTSYYYDDPNDPEKTHYYRNKAQIYVTDYLDGGVTTNWQLVTIPLRNFANLDGWSSMKEFIITFENLASYHNSSPAQGAIYIDEIRFGAPVINDIRIDHFGDNVYLCALGGGMGNMPNEPPTQPYSDISFSNTVSHNSPNSLLSEYYTFPFPYWAGAFIIFGGGNADDSLGVLEYPDKMGFIGVPQNFSDYNYLSFYIRAKSSTENPVTLKVELPSNSGTSSVYITGVTTGWQLARLPLSSFTGLDKSTIKQVNFVYEFTPIVLDGGNWAGGVYIDELQFEK